MNAIEWESQDVDKKSDSTHVAIITTLSESTVMIYLLIEENSVKLWDNLSWIGATPTLSHKDVINRVSIYPI